jgi:hypothetical protein
LTHAAQTRSEQRYFVFMLDVITEWLNTVTKMSQEIIRASSSSEHSTCCLHL